MEDSFFGFDESLPRDGGEIVHTAEPSEEEYDALNDETFGSDIKGDWEEAHECLVRLRGDCNDDILGAVGRSRMPLLPHLLSKHQFDRTGSPIDAETGFNMSKMKLNNLDINIADNESNMRNPDHLNDDLTTWRDDAFLSQDGLKMITKISPQCITPQKNSTQFLSQNFAMQFQEDNFEEPVQNDIGNKGTLFTFGSGPKICKLADIERNLIMQQAMQKLQQNTTLPKHRTHEEGPGVENMQDIRSLTSADIKKTVSQQNALGPTQPQGQRHWSSSPNNLTQHPLGNILVEPQSSTGMRAYNGLPLPLPAFSQGNAQAHSHPHIFQQRLPLNYAYTVPRLTLPSCHLPVALNNFAMHPSFNAIRMVAALVPPPQLSRLPPKVSNTVSNAALVNNQQTNTMFNIFNSRLVQEIQLNHPMLQNVLKPQSGIQIHPYSNVNQKNSFCAQHKSATENMPFEEVDKYANLMSTRDKHWLISIQLSQLNTDTPYIDDFYFTVYKEKKGERRGSSCHSITHKDNQLNHPLTQPRGHAQLILVQLGNKNGARNGPFRERNLSETGNNFNSVGSVQDLKVPYVFTPLKFENSLGKLQYGSVTAPRKIIDADIMSGDMNSTVSDNFKNSTICKTPQTAFEVQTKSTNHAAFVFTSTNGLAMGDMTLTAQRKLRHVLLHIETLFRIVLKLEDLDDPKAIAAILMKKKKETERIAILEQLENANKTLEERASSNLPSQSVKKNFYYDIENKHVLLGKLECGLTVDKVIATMAIRKGKILIRRILPFVRDSPIRWKVWNGVFASLQFILKKDREDVDGVLFALYPELKNQIKGANFYQIVEFCKLMPTKEKKAGCVFCSKFVIASLVCLIIRAEEIYAKKSDPSFSDDLQNEWRQFLNDVAMSLNRTIQNQTILAAIESDCIEPMMTHFARFKDLKLDSLLALATEAIQQVN